MRVFLQLIIFVIIANFSFSSFADQRITAQGGNSLLLQTGGRNTRLSIDSTGILTLFGATYLDNEKEFRFYESDGSGSNYIGFKAPTSLTGDVTFTWPDGDGSASQVLTTNGSGTLSWATSSGGGDSGINYITNGTAEDDTTGWATYADAAGTKPVDGTGGSATITWTRNTTTPSERLPGRKT